MAITKPRNRTVLFRLTQEEYDALQQDCAQQEARSLSDFARDRILRDAPAQDTTGRSLPDAAALTQIEIKLEKLASAVERLGRLVEHLSHRSDEAAAA